MQKEAVKRAIFEVWRGVSERDEGVVAGRNAIAEARLETARLGRLLQPLARSARRAVSQDKAEWLKRRSARIRAEAAAGSSRTLWPSCQTAQWFQESEGTETRWWSIAAEERGRDCGSVGKHLLPESSQARWESVFSQRTLKSRLAEVAHSVAGSPSLRRNGRMRISWLRTPVMPLDGCETEKAMGEDCVPTEYLCAACPGYLRAFARLAQRESGRILAEGEEDAAILERPAGPLRVVGSYRHLGLPC